MSDDFETLIQGKQQQLANLIAGMAQTRAAFSAAAGLRAAVWQDERVAHVVQLEHTITAELSDEQLQSLKQEVGLVRNAAASAVDKELSDALWWHKHTPLPSIEAIQRPEDPWRYKLYGARQSDTIERALRFGFATIATALEKYGYLRSQDKNKREVFEWRERSGRESVAPPGARPYYPWGLDWSDEMKVTMKRYGEQQMEAVHLLKDIQGLEENKRRAEAASRWKSI